MKKWSNPRIKNLSIEETKEMTYSLKCDNCGDVLITWQRAPFPCQKGCGGVYVLNMEQIS